MFASSFGHCARSGRARNGSQEEGHTESGAETFSGRCVLQKVTVSSVSAWLPLVPTSVLCPARGVGHSG